MVWHMKSCPGYSLAMIYIRQKIGNDLQMPNHTIGYVNIGHGEASTVALWLYTIVVILTKQNFQWDV